MRRRCNLGHLILVVVVVLGLTPLMIVVDAQGQIAFVSGRSGNPEIYVMDADGGNLRRLTDNSDRDFSPAWSPDGKRIAFISERDGHPRRVPGWFASEIYVMDADGGNQQNLTNNPANDRSPSWSPDGKRIAFHSNREGRFNYEIYVMDADGGNLQRLTENPNLDEDPAWSPDGERIVFSSAREGHVVHNLDITDEIYVMDADGGNQQRLTENRNNDWNPVLVS